MSKGEGQKVGIKFTAPLIIDESLITLPTYPAISAYTTQTTSSYSSTIAIPEDTQIGDLLVLFWAKDDDPIESVADGWTRIFTSYDTNHRVSVHYKFYTGEEKQFTLTHDSEETTAIVVAIPNADIPVAGTAYMGNTATPTPPALSSGFDADTPTLWFAFAGCDYRDVTGFPSNFTDNNIASNRSGVGLGIASKTSTNATETPSNFTITSTDETSAGMIAIKYKPISEILGTVLKRGLKLEGKEYKYVNGPLIDMEYQIDSAEEHSTIENTLLLTTHPQSRFNNIEGNLTVSYDSTEGILAGSGGPVESFTKVFTPTDLAPKPNPHDAEYIEVTANAEVDLIAVDYSYRYATEYIEVSANATVALIDIDDLNP